MIVMTRAEWVACWQSNDHELRDLIWWIMADTWRRDAAQAKEGG